MRTSGLRTAKHLADACHQRPASKRLDIFHLILSPWPALTLSASRSAFEVDKWLLFGVVSASEQKLSRGDSGLVHYKRVGRSSLRAHVLLLNTWATLISSATVEHTSATAT